MADDKVSNEIVQGDVSASKRSIEMMRLQTVDERNDRSANDSMVINKSNEQISVIDTRVVGTAAMLSLISRLTN